MALSSHGVKRCKLVSGVVYDIYDDFQNSRLTRSSD
jgi:hypothetical protein